MTSSIQTVCCCGTDNEYVEFLLPPECTDKSIGCDCGSSDPYDWKANTHGCGSFNPGNYECAETGRTGCPDDCNPCGAVYLEKNAFYNLTLHTCDGIEWSPTHELMAVFDGWWLVGGQSFTTGTCNNDTPSSTRITTWRDSKPCGTDNNFTKVETNVCLAPEEISSLDGRNPLSSGTIPSTEQVGLSTTRPRDMAAGNITNLNVDTGDAWFAIAFRVQTGATLGRRRIFDQGDDNFGLILDGTTLKACFGSETNSAQEASLATGEWHIVIAKRESGTVSARINGSDFSTNNVSSSDSISTFEQMKINAIDSGDSRFRGQYGDLIVAGGTIEDDDIEKLEWYLANRFNLLGNLPSDHPYKTEAPQVTDLTPKEFTSRLAGHVFKINLPGAGVVPCVLNGGGCLGPSEVTIGSSCKTITSASLKKDCAGNVMFYGSQHPNSANQFPSPPSGIFGGNWYEWSCLYRFWSNTSDCYSASANFCPLTCDDDQDPYTDSLSYVSAEWSRGLWERDCDQCENCNMTDATGLFLHTNTQGCKGGKVHGPKTTIKWEDPFNALYGLTNYTNQDRCPEEFDGFPPDDCCGSDGDSDAAFLISKNSLGPSATCNTFCLGSDFQPVYTYPPFTSCGEYDEISSVFFCSDPPDAGGRPSPCCVNEGQQLPTTYSVAVGELFIPPSQACPDVTGPGCVCEFELAMACGTDPCNDGPVQCRESWDSGSSGYCGPSNCTDNDDPKCVNNCCFQGDVSPRPFGCADYSCGELGYDYAANFVEMGLSRIAGSSHVIFKVPPDNTAIADYEAEGVPANYGFLSFTSLSAATVASAATPAGCPAPINLDCPEFNYPLDSGIKKIELGCGRTIDDVGYHTVSVIWRLHQRRGTYTPPYTNSCPDGTGIVGTYRKLASNGHEPRGTYSAYGNTPSYAPQTITVS